MEEKGKNGMNMKQQTNIGERSPRVGRGVLNQCLYGETPPLGPTPYPFTYHFSRKKYPLRIPSIEKCYPFHIPCRGGSNGGTRIPTPTLILRPNWGQKGQKNFLDQVSHYLRVWMTATPHPPYTKVWISQYSRT